VFVHIYDMYKIWTCVIYGHEDTVLVKLAGYSFPGL